MLKKSYLLILTIIVLTSCGSNHKSEQDYCQYVNPFIGNADNGHTFPGACLPFGLIQASPESGIGSWRYCSGFNYDDNYIEGFAQTHLNGTGVPDLGDMLIFPFCESKRVETFKSRYNKETQQASPGYYSVTLTDVGVEAEITATERTAFHRYTFANKNEARILLDLQRGLSNAPDRVLFSEISTPDEYTIIGQNEVKGWVQRRFSYVIKFDKPYKIQEELSPLEGAKAKRFILAFDTNDSKSVQVKIAISTVNIDGALMALEKENIGWDFSSIKNLAHKKWNDLLSRVKVEGTQEQKINFYTSLYHLYIQPNNIADIDGKYRGANDSVYTSPTGNYYSTLSLWDTYRAAHPLYTILTPEKVDDFVHTMLAHQETQGYLPIWTLWGKENFCMLANHAIPVIVDTYLKGFRGFDVDKAYEAMKISSTVSHPYSDWETYNKYGYYPFDILKDESVSRTLESAYDDYCIAQMAKALGKADDYEYFMKRANFYKNLFDTETGFMRGKDSKGNWRIPFSPLQLSHYGTIGGDFTEANSWQYTWHVQQDIEGLIELMGGKSAFEAKLDKLFSTQASIEETGEVLDVTGLIGQYAHGNEPCHHIAYLYNYVGKPQKTQDLIRKIFDQFYLPKPDGLCGNDDCGQMSAWYIFSAMGFYPVNPIGGEYVLGAPQVEEVELSLPDSKVFRVKAKNLSKENKFVKSVSLNGIKLDSFKIHHKDITRGGELVFEMTKELGK